jgi:hypothetical protein
MPVVRRYIKGPMWMHFLVGAAMAHMLRQEQQRPSQEATASAAEASEALTSKTQEESHLERKFGDAYESTRESRNGYGYGVTLLYGATGF